MHASLFHLCQKEVSSQLRIQRVQMHVLSCGTWLSCHQRRSPDPGPAPGLHLISPLSLPWSCIIQHSDKEKTGQQKYLTNGSVKGRGWEATTFFLAGKPRHLRNPSSELLYLTHPTEPQTFPSGARISRRVVTSLYSTAPLRAAESEIQQDQEGMLLPLNCWV